MGAIIIYYERSTAFANSNGLSIALSIAQYGYCRSNCKLRKTVNKEKWRAC